jgi:ribosomal-protein-serine acetyltransferase
MLAEPRTIRTRRLRLETIGPNHADDLWKATRASAAELLPWMVWAADPRPEATRAFTENARRDWESGRAWIFSVVVDESSAGTVGLSLYQPLLQSAQLGYWLRSDLAGRGLMTEAAAAAVEFGFDELALHRIELHASPTNCASIRVAEKLGFRREGLMREAARGAGGFHDAYVYGLLETDDRHAWHRIATGRSLGVK